MESTIQLTTNHHEPLRLEDLYMLFHFSGFGETLPIAVSWLDNDMYALNRA